MSLQELLQRVKEYGGAVNIRDDLDKGKTQFDFTLLPEGRALGLTPADVGRQLRGAFYGSLALRLLRGTNEIEVRVKLPEAEREDIYHLEDLVIRAPDGAEVPLLDVAEVRTAVPLSDDQQARLKAALENATGKSLELKAIVDPTVVGGVVATVGDTVIDGSVRTRVDQLKSRL